MAWESELADPPANAEVGKEMLEYGEKIVDAMMSKRKDFALLLRVIAGNSVGRRSLFKNEGPDSLIKSISQLPDPSAAREALILMRDRDVIEVSQLFHDLAKRYDGQDIFYRAALNIACGTDPKRREAILADFDKHFPEWNDKVG